MLPIAYRIDGPWSGELAIISRPRGGEWLEDELRSLKEAEFAVLLSLLTKDEAKELGVVKEAELSAKCGLDFLSFPIPDLGVPDSPVAARNVLVQLLDQLHSGKKIAVHCRQGIGRSALIVASLLVMAGLEPSAAFRKVSAARGLDVPETSQQRDWVMELAHNINELARA
jgi:protein-tyrosine phosphatase